MGNRPTIRDVAKLAGLSIASVSRALTRPDSVKDDTRTRVNDAARSIGFQFNRQAIDFRRGRSDALIVLVSDIANPFFPEFFKGIEKEARERGFTMLIGDTSAGPQSEATYVGMLAAGKADGLISNIGRLPEGLPQPAGTDESYRGPPIVACNHDAGAKIPMVRIDNYSAGKLAAEHLLQLGHRRFAQIHGSLEFADFRARLAGFSDTVANAGYAVPSSALIPGDLRVQSGRDAVMALLSQDVRPSAIFAHNDEMALGAMHQLSLSGFRVPSDVSVVGFDDLSYASATTPAITTMRLPREVWGATACKKLIDQILGVDNGPHDQMLAAELVVRESTAAFL